MVLALAAWSEDDLPVLQTNSKALTVIDGDHTRINYDLNEMLIHDTSPAGTPRAPWPLAGDPTPIGLGGIR